MMLDTKLNTVQRLSCVIDEVDGCIRKYDETSYLALFHSDKKCEIIFDRIR